LRYLLVIGIFYAHLGAFDTETAAKIYNTIFTALDKSGSVDVYTDDEEYKTVVFQAPNLRLSETSQEASIILQTKKGTRYHHDKIIFTTNYRILRQNSDIIGAFYWSKGRPQIIFIRPRLEKKKITLPDNFKKYIVDTL
jgi:hypothetical protein